MKSSNLTSENLQTDKSDYSTQILVNRVRIQQIEMDISIFDALKPFLFFYNGESRYPNVSQYWDEAYGFIMVDKELLPLSRFGIFLETEDTNIPPIELFQKSPTRFEFYDGRHRFARLILKFLKDPTFELVEGVHYVVKKQFATQSGLEDAKTQQFLFLDRSKNENKFFILDGNRKVIKSVCKKEFKEKDLPFIGYKKGSYKFFGCERKDAYAFIVSLHDKVWRCQSGLFSITKNFCAEFIGKMMSCVHSLQVVLEALNDKAFVPLLLDVVAMLSSLSSPMPNFDSFFVRILRIYSIYLRGKSLFVPQGVEEAMMLAALLPLFPPALVELIKRMQLFTSKKLLDSPGVLFDFFGDLGKFVSYILELVPVPDFIRKVVNKVFSIGFRFKSCNTLRRLITLWKTDKRVITEPSFTKEVYAAYDELTSDYDSYQFFLSSKKPLWEDFLRLRKAVLSYHHVNRQEPFCLIFQGPPGTKKSYIMNRVIQFDKESTYVHVVKATTDGKDFYDGYDNESYFVMDDVGQMGVSQWRTIINMVSTVKLPLDCAEASLKETKFFNSDVILVTTNKFTELHGLTKSDGIDNLEALWRRGHVLSFDRVIRNGADLDGIVDYKRFDVNANIWVKSFIPGIMPDEFPSSMSANNENKLLAWISSIISFHKKFFMDVKELVEITDSQRQDISDYKNEFLNLPRYFSAESVFGWCLESFYDVKDIVGDMLTELIGEVMKFVGDFSVSQLIHQGKTELKRVYKEFSSYIHGVVLALIIISVFVSAYNLFFSSSEVVRGSLIDDIKRVMDRDFAPQSGTSTIVNAVQSRMLFIEVHRSDGTTDALQAFVSGLCLLVPYHVSTRGIVSISGYLDFDQVHNRVKCLDHIRVEVVYANKDADVCVLKLPEFFSSPFKCGKRLLRRDCFEVKASVLPSRNVFFVNKYKSIPINRVWVNHGQDIEYYSDSYKNLIKTEDSLTYCLTQVGLCGSLIVDQELGIMGMHVAGDSQVGVSIIFNKKVLQELYRVFENCVVAYKNVPEIREEKMSELRDFSGTVLNKSYHIEVPKKTNFVESPLKAVVESHVECPLKIPAELNVLGPGTIHEMAKKSFQLVHGYAAAELDFAKKCLNVLIPQFSNISEFEVIKGNEFLPRFNMKSVNGLGYNKLKTDYIDMESGTITAMFRSKLDEFERRVKHKELTIDDVVLYETLKDELRMPDKATKPRTFRISPLHLVFLMKKLYGDLASQIIKDRWNNGIAIGMNPYSDWNELYNILRPLNVFDGDVGQWDGKQPPELQDLVALVLNEKYIGPDVELMKFFSEYLVRVNVAIMNRTVQTTHSVSSGYWMTALGNSILNRAHTSICYYRECVKLKRVPSVSEFLKIRDFVLGDDKLVGVPKDLAFVNAKSMCEYFESIGMTFTDGLKNRVNQEFMDLSQVSFLKRKFRYHTELKRVICPLELSSIFSSLCFFDKTKDFEVVMKGKIESAQRELWLHELDYNWLLIEAKKQGLFFVTLNSVYLKNLFLDEVELAWKLYLFDSGKIDECVVLSSG